jgi:hypothetical protein
MSGYIRLSHDGRDYNMFGQIKPCNVRLNHVRYGSLVQVRSSKVLFSSG